MNRRLRRVLVSSGVVASLVVGVASIRLAADLTADAAPPPVPPISMRELQSELQAEQARAESLQGQLDDLLGVTSQLTSALDAAQEQVSDDGLSATQLRERLKAAEARLKLVNKLLKQANARLAALGQSLSVPPAGGGSGGTGSGGGSGSGPAAGAGATPTPRPTATPTGAFSLVLAIGGGGVVADWTTCTAAGFDSYALVRSSDLEVHFPPEDRDTVVARISSVSTTKATDAAAPAGSNWYRAYCLTLGDGELRTAATTAMVGISVP